MRSRLAIASCAICWLFLHRGTSGLFLALAHLLTLPLDPLVNAAWRLGLTAWWVASMFINCLQADGPCLPVKAWSIGLDVVALAILAGAAAEPVLDALCREWKNSYVAHHHAAWVRTVSRCSMQWIQAGLTIVATATEWFLICDLICGRIFHIVDPRNRRGSYANLRTSGGQLNPDVLGILVHGLDSDASSLSLLAHVLVLQGLPVALCDYHTDFEKGYLHVAEDSIREYASTCLSQIALLLQPGQDVSIRRVLLIGYVCALLRLHTRAVPSASAR